MKTKKLDPEIIKIQVQTALRLMYTYLLRFPNPLRKEDGAILKGFSLTRDDIEKVLFQKNKDGSFKKDQNGNYLKTEADYVHIAFGHHYGDKHPSGSGPVLNRPTIIAFGMKEDRSALLTNETVFNYCDPCPSRCPKFDEAVQLIEDQVLRDHFPEHQNKI